MKGITLGRLLISAILSTAVLLVSTEIASANETVSRVAGANGGEPYCNDGGTPLIWDTRGVYAYSRPFCNYSVTVPSVGDLTSLSTTLNQALAANKKELSDDQAKLRADLTAQIGNVLTPALLKQITDSVTQAATKQVMDNLRQQGVIK